MHDNLKERKNNLEAQKLVNFYNKVTFDCDICLNKISLVKISSEILYDNHYHKFIFYFSKGINEILANVNTSHVILFKDYLFYDDDSEYMKRYYQSHESIPRF